MDGLVSGTEGEGRRRRRRRASMDIARVGRGREGGGGMGVGEGMPKRLGEEGREDREAAGCMRRRGGGTNA